MSYGIGYGQAPLGYGLDPYGDPTYTPAASSLSIAAQTWVKLLGLELQPNVLSWGMQSRTAVLDFKINVVETAVVLGWTITPQTTVPEFGLTTPPGGKEIG